MTREVPYIFIRPSR